MKNNYKNIKYIITNYIEDISVPIQDYNVHLGVFIEPYLTYILDGKKTWESRFSINKTAPFGKVFPNDLLLIKKSGGPIVAIAIIQKVLSFRLDQATYKKIKKDYSELLCIHDPSFWEMKSTASYCSIMRLDKLIKIKPCDFVKKDRRGWIVYKDFSHILRL
jgi:hypothetical protein